MNREGEINKHSTHHILYHQNLTTTRAIFKHKNLASSPECVGSPEMKIECSKNAWDFKFANISCGEFACSTVLLNIHSIITVIYK